jgi:Domain of unknown function DUF29
MSDLYDTDIALWAEHQAELLRRRASNELDWPALAEEIEDVARRERDQIESRVAVLCEHLLKWQFQPEQRGGSWRGSIVEARDRIARVVRNSPSLHSYPAVALAEAYAAGRRKAEAETELTELPTECPWTIEQVRDHDFWPDEKECLTACKALGEDQREGQPLPDRAHGRRARHGDDEHSSGE